MKYLKITIWECEVGVETRTKKLLFPVVRVADFRLWIWYQEKEREERDSGLVFFFFLANDITETRSIQGKDKKKVSVCSL